MKGYGPLMDEPGPKPCVLLADKGYDADFIRADLDARSVASVIPARRNRKVHPVIDGHIYSLRNLVERCFSKLKHSRRLATRYDKTACPSSKHLAQVWRGVNGERASSGVGF